MGIFERIFKIFKPIEDLMYKYYDNDYMIYAIVVIVLLFFALLGFFIFKIVMRILT